MINANIANSMSYVSSQDIHRKINQIISQSANDGKVSVYFDCPLSFSDHDVDDMKSSLESFGYEVILIESHRLYIDWSNPDAIR